MEGLLKGKCAVITGAGNQRGIGFATACLFAESGARVALLDVDGDAAALASGIGPSHLGLAIAVTDEASVHRAVGHDHRHRSRCERGNAYSLSGKILWRG
jgi:NAD(P)-dependent dehydrogenase (short-subunit alcohol dehydrogenase family)